MATRTTNANEHVAPPPGLPECSQPTPLGRPEDSPTPSCAASIDAEGLLDNGTKSGRKRKLNSMSSRGVANLTPDQLAKKRANDRQAQRAIRERTKGHIEALEQQVRDLSSQKPYLDLQEALRQNETVRSENAELRQGLKAAMDILQPLIAKPELSDASPSLAIPTPIPPPSQTSPLPDTDHLTPIPGDKFYAESLASLDTPSPTHSAPTFGSRRNSTNGCPPSTSLRVAWDSQRHNITHGLDLGSEERLGFNFLLGSSHSVPKLDLLHANSPENIPCAHLNPSAPIYPHPLTTTSEPGPPAFAAPIQNLPATCPLDNILLDFLHSRQREAAQGIPRQKLAGPPYPSVSSLLNPERSVYSHPVSKVFTDILRTFPDLSTLPVQVAVLYTMFLLMRWQIYPTQENYERLPEWLTPRPTQILHPHPAWMDYVPWPAMRDRIITNYQNYPFENWFIPFTTGMRVNWPYEDTDCLLSAGDSDELVINPVFERHMRNLSNWSLGTSFAETYPCLADTARIKSTTQHNTPGGPDPP
ncbi:Protein of unknown function DUF3425 [Penicillium expansum]|uniref:BZIP transcription factor n=1 Tax=Penicillium expansum TaxID=27334 RepID=A0A0A2JDM0_PENEN|nr:Protein of unknown function DUF3425 [Penicillium expansum]KGO46646.1 Protein of unknown function DUF3425 [Penicillium expansum]KGO53517.1 Protein of unknown function DUF3425 [Penicillium expansum]KGO66219.1 Protein of unknown function DUF3425 [Penicillium expansum]